MSASAAAPVLPGETLAGKYRIERVLGQGGMGIVVAARHVDLDERVAIKFLLGDTSARAADRFLREARAAARVKGEHVCRVFDFGRIDTGEPYIVMEYLEGIDLGTKLLREGPQPVPRVVAWTIEVCAALAEAHRSGIVHRDVKPANIFIATRPDGSSCAKVLDFGISKLPQLETITTAEQLMGSPMYMSPEQMHSARDVDARSDVWSVGVMMYKLLTGEAPFNGDSMMELALQVREKEPPPIELLQPSVPAGLRRVIARCIAKKPADRHGSIAALVAELAPMAPVDVAPLAARIAMSGESEGRVALEAAIGAVSSPAPAEDTLPPLETNLGGVGSPKKASRRAWIAAAMVTGALALAVGALRPGPRATPPPPSPAASPAPAACLAPTDPFGRVVPPSVLADSAGAIAADAGVPARVSPTRIALPKARPSASPAAPNALPSPSAGPAVEARSLKRRDIDRDDP